MSGRQRWVVMLGSVALGCGPGADRPPGSGDAADPAAVEAPAVADSLVLQVGEVQVWLTDARAATGSSGEVCVERAVEIRRDTARIRVPLLYTREAPVRLDDTSMQAVLSNGCAPAGRYRVDFATGSPRRMPDR